MAELVARVTGAPFLGIVGPSGSGKSSVLHAGLLAALAAGVLPGSEAWALAVLRPGEHPLRALDQALAPLPDHGRLVVAVDQFEEVFTTCRDETERAAFVDALVACGARLAPAYAGGRRRARRLLRSLRGVHGAVPALGRRPRARRPDAARTSCAVRSSCRPAGRGWWSSASWSTRWWPTSRASRVPCRWSRRRCWSCGSAARAARCACPTTSRPGEFAARSRDWPNRPTSGSTPRAGGSPGGSCCGWPGRARATPSCGAAPG